MDIGPNCTHTCTVFFHTQKYSTIPIDISHTIYWLSPISHTRSQSHIYSTVLMYSYTKVLIIDITVY